MLKLLEWCVALRSRWGQMPYGDQGLLIHRSLYERVGGYRSLALMEDVDLIQRLQQISRIGALGCALTTSARRWNPSRRFEPSLEQCSAQTTLEKRRGRRTINSNLSTLIHP
jgi:hypothetical protein